MNWSGLGDITLLIADDDAFNRQLIIALFAKNSNIKVLEARDGLETLKILSQNSVDMLLLDYHMPRMNGAKTLQSIKEESKFYDMPIAIITTDESEMRHLYALGADDFIVKPFAFEELRSCIYKHIAKKSR